MCEQSQVSAIEEMAIEPQWLKLGDVLVEEATRHGKSVGSIMTCSKFLFCSGLTTHR